jgi:SAM-dependent methyltransferase
MLADLADSVDAVDSSLHKLRVLAASEHNLRPKVRPIHASRHRLPYVDGVFDTIVADPTDDWEPQEVVSQVRRLLADDGTFFLKLDSPFERPDTSVAGTDWSWRSVLVSITTWLRGGRATHYKRLLEDIFDTVQLVALFPTKTKGQFVFEESDEFAASYLLADKVDRKFGNPLRAVAQRLVPAVARFGAVPRGRLIVCSNREPRTPERLPELGDYERLLIRGQRRTVIIYVDEDGIGCVCKIPKNTRKALYDDRGVVNENEQSLLDELRAVDDPIVSTFPEGRLERTPLGPIRIEQPVDGIPVGKRIKQTPTRFRRNLRSGFDWILRFQQVYGGEPVVHPPAEVQTQLSVPSLELEPPEIPSPVTVFDTPAKSDHSPENLYVNPQTDEVIAAIDWEGGTRHGNPFRDSCKYALTLAVRTFGGFEEGLRRAFLEDSPYSAIVQRTVAEYTNRLGLEPQGFAAYLALPYVHKLSNDYLDESTPTIWNPSMVSRVELIWSHQDAVLDRLC